MTQNTKDASQSALALGTLAIHGGQSPDPTTGAVMPPIYATSTYAQSSPGVHQGFEYSRTHNPTRFAYERCVAALEGGTRGFAFASGMAATSTLLEMLDSGDHVVAVDDLYGGTYRLFERVRRRSAGLDFSFVDLTDLAAFESFVRGQPLVRECWMLSGEIDFVLKCVAPDLKTFQTFVEKLTAAPNVRNVKTSLVLRQSKDAAMVPMED